jgi:hypothetical protein
MIVIVRLPANEDEDAEVTVWNVVDRTEHEQGNRRQGFCQTWTIDRRSERAITSAVRDVIDGRRADRSRRYGAE